MKYLIATTFCLLLFFAPVYSQHKYKLTQSGIRYEIYRSQSTKKIKVDDIITFNFIEKSENDSMLFSTYRSQPFKMQVRHPKRLADLMEIFVLLRENDSVWISIPADSLFDGLEIGKPQYLAKGSRLIFHIKIEKVQTVEEAIEEENTALETEQTLLKKYIADNNLKPIYTASGLVFLNTKSSQGARPAPGDTVYIHYRASLLNGKVFDTSIESEAIKEGLVQPGREYGPICFQVGINNIITPWDEGIMLMAESSSARLIIPSTIAFGAQGFGKFVKPYTTFIIDVTLLKISKPAPAKQVNKDYKIVKDSHLYRLSPLPVFKSLLGFLSINDERKSHGRIYDTSDKQWLMPWIDIINQAVFN